MLGVVWLHKIVRQFMSNGEIPDKVVSREVTGIAKHQVYHEMYADCELPLLTLASSERRVKQAEFLRRGYLRHCSKYRRLRKMLPFRLKAMRPP